MGDLSATAASVPAAPRRSPRGAVIVGDYLGEPAAEAARAVRRVGLRPGLDRHFGGEPHTIGLVLAQEPGAGSEAPRGAMVTLYVSAPTAGAQEPEHTQGRDDPMRSDAPPARPSPTGASPGRARRKRRPRAAAPALHREPPGPVRVEESPEPVDAAANERSHWPGGDQGEHSAEQSDPASDQLTLAMLRDVFQPDAAGSGGRGIYPRKPVRLRLRGGWAWLKAHRPVAVLACVFLALWVGVAVTGERKMNRQRAHGLARGGPPTRRARTDAAPRVSAAGRSLPPARGSRTRGHTSRVTARAPEDRRAAGAARRTGQATAPTGSPSVRGESPPAAASAAPGPPATQSRGGPFSP
jgi:hypothetical protein